ncbi:hypothetical protein KY330_05250 [Candidatus Woesearchaeota archaeon]|nr:hypothetical protein [Candidatus Woesearchaeota archaeon]
MGGSIALTIREPNGKEHRMCRSTKILPSLVNNLRLINKDTSFIQGELKPWYEMREDYLKHEKEWLAIQKKHDSCAIRDSPFENNMTSCYGDHPFLAPTGYGLVVIDMLKDQILSTQGYTCLGNIYGIQIRHDLREDIGGGHTVLYIGPEDKRPKRKGLLAFDSDDEYSNAMRFKALYEAGKVKKAVNEMSGEIIPLEGKSLEEIADMVMKSHDLVFPIDFSPFTIRDYAECDKEDAIVMRSRIEELGFTLSDKEKELWDSWVKEMDEE